MVITKERTKTVMSNKKQVKSFLVRSEMILVYAIIIIFIISGIKDSTFIVKDNIVAMFKAFSFLGIMAVPLTFLFISLAFDMSIGQSTALAGAIVAIMMRDLNISFIIAIPIALAIGALCGYINAVLVTKVKINAFIATLGTLYIYKGIVLVITDEKTVSGIKDKISFIPDYILGIPLNTIALTIIAIIGTIILTKTKFGRRVFVVGNNVEFAKQIGIQEARTKTILFTVTGICAGICGLIYVATYRSLPTNTGVKWEFLVTAGCMLGGCSIYGGRGSVGGSLLGVGFMTAIQFALRSWQVQSNLQTVFIGAILIFAIMLDTIKEKKLA